MNLHLKGVTVLGVKKNDFNGNIDGQNIVSDSTSFFLVQDLPSDNGKAAGQASQEFKFGTAEEFEKWKKLEFPVVADGEMSIETNGKNVSKMVLKKIVLCPVQPGQINAPKRVAA